MDRNPVADPFDAHCPVRNILARLGDKWSMLVIYTLAPAEKMRFGDLRRSIPDISPKMLTATLRVLEEDGLVSRAVFAEVPPRTEYGLTPRARTLLPHLQALVDWALEHMDDILRDRRSHRAL